MELLRPILELGVVIPGMLLLLLSVFAACSFAEVLDHRRTVCAVMSPEEVGRPISVVLAIALPV